jgi:hypothetical protein
MKVKAIDPSRASGPGPGDTNNAVQYTHRLTYFVFKTQQRIFPSLRCLPVPWPFQVNIESDPGWMIALCKSP